MATDLNTIKNNSIANKYLTQADSAIASMTGAGATAASGATSAAAAAADKAAAGADKTAARMTETSGAMRTIGVSLLPIADTVAGDATAVRGIADTNLDLSKPWFQQSEGLLKLDETAGGISGEYAKLYKDLDPNLQMAMAAADARKEAQSQTDSATRSLLRAGVSPTASALATIRSRALDQTTAIVASVKTQARQMGITLQMDALEKGLNMAMGQAGVGQKFADSAAGEFVNAAKLSETEGQLRTGAASIYGSSANLLADAQKLVQDAASGKIQASSIQVSAANAAVQAFATAAEYYSAQASSFRGLAEEGGNEKLF